MAMIACMFGGQGTQHPGMGAELLARYPAIVKIADEVLQYSIVDLCLRGGSRLNRTEYTQPAIFVVNALMYSDHLRRCPEPPAYFLGHSLGELNALHAAGVFDFETGLRIVKRRGELMSRYGEEGTMAALVGPRERVLAFLAQEHARVFVAIDNSPTQIVVAGASRDIAQFQNAIRQHNGISMIPLQVSGPFHSPLMRRARDEFREFLEGQSFNALRVPVIANISASPYTADAIRDFIADLLVSCIRWFDSIRYLAQRDPTLFVELGPRPILSPMVRQIIIHAANQPLH
jgi:malonyl CoA-acyl carrier protein transacylase